MTIFKCSQILIFDLKFYWSDTSSFLLDETLRFVFEPDFWTKQYNPVAMIIETWLPCYDTELLNRSYCCFFNLALVFVELFL